MKINHDASFNLWAMALDVRDLAAAMNSLIDQDGQPGMQAVLSVLLEKAEALKDALDGPVREGASNEPR